MCSDEVQGRSEGNEEIERFARPAIVGILGDRRSVKMGLGRSCLRLLEYFAELDSMRECFGALMEGAKYGRSWRGGSRDFVYQARQRTSAKAR